MVGVDSSTIVAIATVFGVALTAAGLLARRLSKYLQKRRNHLRTEDLFYGWVDDRGKWHPGELHRSVGYTDDQGTFHPGYDARLRAIEPKVGLPIGGANE